MLKSNIMVKNIFKLLGFLLIIALFYYLGTQKIHTNFVSKKPTKSSRVIVSPTITPFPTINPFDSLHGLKSDVEYSDIIYGVSFIYPQSFVINGTKCNLSIERFSQVPHSSMWNYIHIAIIPRNKVDTCDWLGYSGQDMQYNKLETIQVGQTKIISPKSMPEFSKYTRLSDEVVNKNIFQHFVNYKAWESSPNTNEHIFKLDSDSNTIWIMGFTNEDLSQPDSISYLALKKIVYSLNSKP